MRDCQVETEALLIAASTTSGKQCEGNGDPANFADDEHIDTSWQLHHKTSEFDQNY